MLRRYTSGWIFETTTITNQLSRVIGSLRCGLRTRKVCITRRPWMGYICNVVSLCKIGLLFQCIMVILCLYGYMDHC